MVKVAISGGTGGVGRAIIQHLEGQHEYIILTRASSSSTLEDKLQKHAVPVDYDDIDAVASVLEQHGVHTVICASSMIPQGAGQAQLNLIRAAEKSKVTKRFVPSEFAVPGSEQVLKLIFYEYPKIEAIQLLEQTSLEFTLIHCGFFLDYFGSPHYPSYLAPVHLMIDMENNFAVIPGSGDVPFVLTHTYDLGNFVSGILNLPEGTWSRNMFVVGNRLTFKELVKIAEEAKGTKFEVRQDDLESVKAGKVTELPIHQAVDQSKQYGSKEALHKFISNVVYMIEGHDFSFDGETAINEKFPDIKTRTAMEVMSAWKGK